MLKDQLELSTPVYMTHLTTDKPMYKPGETVSFRSLTLDRSSLRPPDVDFQLTYTLKYPDGHDTAVAGGISRLVDPEGKPLMGPDKKFLKGLGAGDIFLGENPAGGEYILTVSEAQNRFPAQQRKFIVNKYEKTRFNKELNFSKKSFGAGEEVVAVCKAVRAEATDAVAKPLNVRATMIIDNQVYGIDGKVNGPAFTGQTDKNGKVTVRFKLPDNIDRGEGSLTVIFDGGDGPDSLLRPIPIVAKKLQVDFYPEGGELVAGVPNRVYFQVHTLLGKAAELTGRLVDNDGKVVVEKIQTLNDADNP
jgi:alpha-2-macroglobulin-like protein